MPIDVRCDACGSSFRVSETLAGRKGKCAKCKTPMVVPETVTDLELVEEHEPEPVPIVLGEVDTYELADARPRGKDRVRRAVTAPESLRTAKETLKAERTRTPHEILAAFRGEIPPVRPTWTYRFWILIVAAVMLLLPLIYVGVALLAALALLWHATHNIVIFQNVRNAKAALLLYVGPLIVGGFLVAFLFKPLFAGRGKRPKMRELTPEVEPLLFAFVEGICGSVGAPLPSRVFVNCEVNASAHLESGALALRRRLALTIGLPLVAGLTLRQFAGVLAHEFGHFSQGAGMRLGQLIFSINVWFARVVYERDSWDETLDAWVQEGSYLTIIALITKLVVWMTRRLLWCLMHIGHMVSSFLARQQEFDADRYEARMVGGDTFAATSLRLRELGLASQGAESDLGRSWQERRLPDNYARLVVANVPQIPPQVMTMVREAALNAKTGLFDTHPCDKDRIARARREQTDGIFHLDGPATDLFCDFDALSRASTYDFYRGHLGPEISKDQLFAVADLLDAQAESHQGNEAYDRLFLGSFSLAQSLPLKKDYPKAPANPKTARAQLVDARASLLAAAEDNSTALVRWNELSLKALSAEAAVTVWKAGGKHRPGDFEFEGRTQSEAESTVARSDGAIRELDVNFEPFSEAAARRIELALSLLELPAVLERIPDGAAIRDEARRVYPCAAVLATRVIPQLPPTQRSLAVLARLLQKFQAGKNDKDQTFIHAILRAACNLNERLVELHARLPVGVEYPFDHARADTSVARFILERVPGPDDIGGMVDAATGAEGRLCDLQRRCLGTLAVAVEAVETALKLPVLERPVAEEVPDA